jgi:hypothetical protein
MLTDLKAAKAMKAIVGSCWFAKSGKKLLYDGLMMRIGRRPRRDLETELQSMAQMIVAP